MPQITIDLEDKIRPVLNLIEQAILALESQVLESSVNSQQNKESSMTDQRVTVSTAFQIIIHHFSGNTILRTKAEITDRVLDVREASGGIREFAVADPVNKVLHYLKQFDLAENPEHGYWRIKSVDDMCARLQALVYNRNIGDEGEDF